MHADPELVRIAGCIFHYDKDFPEGSGKGFKESDTPNFTGSYYSHTKVRPPSRHCMLSKILNVIMHARLGCCTCFKWHMHVLQALVEGLLSEYPNILVLRVRMPIVGDLTYPRNFIAKIIKYEKVRGISHCSTLNLACSSASIQDLFAALDDL